MSESETDRSPLRVLIAENVEDDALLMVEELRRAGYTPTSKRVQTALDFNTALARGTWDIVLVDYMMGGFTGMQALEIYKKSGLDIPFLLVSGSIGEEKAVEFVRSGAHDYLMKDRLSRLGGAVRRELREAANRGVQRAGVVEIQRLNDALQKQVELLSRANTHLEQLTFAASHDLKEPLRTVTSYTQLLLKRRSSPDEQDEFGEYIRDGVERMRTLIDGLEAFARTSHWTGDIPRPVDADAVAADAVVLLTEAIEATRAVLTINPLPAVIMERIPLIQVFQNLIANALKYRRGDAPPDIRISAEEQHGEVRFAVSDNGIGISPEHHDDIFLLFRRLHGVEYPGIGLGLALCKRTVEHYGGRMWVASDLGVGSIFYFTLPLATNVAAAAS